MRRSVLLLFLACAAHLGAQAPRSAPARPVVVLVSIDGLEPEYVLQADTHQLKIPNLRALLARGAHATGVTGVVPTVTYPSHTTLVTGVAPARHGIITNTTFDSFDKNQCGWYWYASDIRVPTLWDAISAAGGTTGNVHWSVTVGARITWNLPQIWRTGEADDRKLVKALSTPGAAARATLERIDAIVGRLHVAASKAYGDNVVMVIASDHGFKGTTRSLHLIQAFRSAGFVVDSANGIGRIIDDAELRSNGSLFPVVPSRYA